MGLSGGSKSESKSYSGSAQAWAQPYAKSAAGDVQSVQAYNQPRLQGMADALTGQMVPQLLNKFNVGNPLLKQSQGYLSNVLSGAYMGGNPYLDAVLSKTNRDVTDNVNSQFATAGRYGSGAYADVLSRNLADADNAARMADYNTQMSRMDAAAAAAPGMAQADYIGLPEILQTMTTGAQIPYAGSNATANALAALFNGGTQSQTQTQSGGLLGGLGSILGGIGAMGSGGIFSDRRLKRDIEKLGELADGLGVYRFRYNAALPGLPEGVFTGVMADEVEALRPWALGPERDGYKTVNYAVLEDA